MPTPARAFVSTACKESKENLRSGRPLTSSSFSGTATLSSGPAALGPVPCPSPPSLPPCVLVRSPPLPQSCSQTLPPHSAHSGRPSRWGRPPPPLRPRPPQRDRRLPSRLRGRLCPQRATRVRKGNAGRLLQALCSPLLTWGDKAAQCRRPQKADTLGVLCHTQHSPSVVDSSKLPPGPDPGFEALQRILGVPATKSWSLDS